MQGAAGDATPPGAVAVREDVPLKAGGGGGGGGGAGCCAGGPRLVLACFAALSTAITLALFTQIYSGDYEVVPHGSVSSSAQACSRAGTDALKAGGCALDAAAAAALCLAVLAPHRTSLDATGSLLLWEYRQSRSEPPTLAEWGGAGAGAGAGDEAPPRLVAALAALHAQHGALPWPRLLQPAILLARNGFNASEGLLSAQAQAGAPDSGLLQAAPHLADYLQTLQHNTSAELAAAWGGGGVTLSSAVLAPAGRWRVAAGGARAPLVRRALRAALDPPPADVDDAVDRAVKELQQGVQGGEAGVAGGVATGLAVVDRLDTYVALVTGLSRPFGAGPAAAAGWVRDAGAPLDLAPAIMLDDRVCGTRYVVGAESSAALAQAGAALCAGGGGAAPAVERARAAWAGAGLLPETALAAPRPAVNLVQQTGDALLSHADSRGGGHALRF